MQAHIIAMEIECGLVKQCWTCGFVPEYPGGRRVCCSNCTSTAACPNFEGPLESVLSPENALDGISIPEVTLESLRIEIKHQSEDSADAITDHSTRSSRGGIRPGLLPAQTGGM